jgi:hypothetical protein
MTVSVVPARSARNWSGKRLKISVSTRSRSGPSMIAVSSPLGEVRISSTNRCGSTDAKSSTACSLSP